MHDLRAHVRGVAAQAGEHAHTRPDDRDGAPAWVLTTEEGKTHRFRDPTTLQKWIVERRVGRADRVTPPGASARRLGDMDELRPFFDLVDQADRAASSRVARPTQPETPQRLSAAGARGYASPDEDDDDVLMSGRRSRGGQRGRPSRLDSDIAAGLSGMGVDDSIDVVLPQRKMGKYAFAGVVIAGLMVGAWYLGKGRPIVDVASAPAAAPGAPPAAAPTPPAVAPTPPAVAPTHRPSPRRRPHRPRPRRQPLRHRRLRRAPPPAAAPTAPASPPPAAATRTPPEDMPPEPVPPVRKGAAPRGYEQLVAEADRALENGNTAKAQKFIDEALRLQPSGVAAVTSSAYLLLDKQKPLAAVGEFKRALNLSPNFSQALFGLGEAYRAAGNPAQAIEAYKRYLAASPAGSDAPAARRQIRELETQPVRPSHSTTANVPAPGGSPPPMPEPAPPP